MNNLKKYSKPFMVAEKFEPDYYCIPCNPPHEIVSYTLKDPYPNWTHFVVDSDGDQVCTEADLHSENAYLTTTDNSNHGQPLTVHEAPSVCWPCIGSTPQTLDDVKTWIPLWYATNEGNHSGHVYCYETLVINYTQS